MKLDQLVIPAVCWASMEAHIRSQAPEEACGLVFARNGTITEIVPVTNILHSPVRYQMDPQGQIDAFLRMEARGLDLLAIYHSHPHGPSYPSQTDLAESYYPDTVYLIWFPAHGGWDCKGFYLESGTYREIGIQIEERE